LDTFTEIDADNIKIIHDRESIKSTQTGFMCEDILCEQDYSDYESLPYEIVMYGGSLPDSPLPNMLAKYNSVNDWEEHFPLTEVPEVDFENEMLVGIFIPFNDGGPDTIKVGKIIKNNDSIIFQVLKIETSYSCMVGLYCFSGNRYKT
jgi:hypothetical protein